MLYEFKSEREEIGGEYDIKLSSLVLKQAQITVKKMVDNRAAIVTPT